MLERTAPKQWQRVLLLGGFAGVAIAAVYAVVFVVNGVLLSLGRSADWIYGVVAAMFAAGLAVLACRARMPVLPLPVAFIGALVGPMLAFFGVLLFQAHAIHWPLFLAAVLVAIGVGVFSKEAFDQARGTR